MPLHADMEYTTIFTDCTHMMMEVRLETEYGGYLAQSIEKVKEDISDENTHGRLVWRQDWQAIA